MYFIIILIIIITYLSISVTLQILFWFYNDVVFFVLMYVELQTLFCPEINAMIYSFLIVIQHPTYISIPFTAVLAPLFNITISYHNQLIFNLKEQIVNFMTLILLVFITKLIYEQYIIKYVILKPAKQILYFIQMIKYQYNIYTHRYTY